MWEYSGKKHPEYWYLIVVTHTILLKITNTARRKIDVMLSLCSLLHVMLGFIAFLHILSSSSVSR